MATKFVTAPYDANRRKPSSQLRISAIGARAGIKAAKLKMVPTQYVDTGLVILTNEGWGRPDARQHAPCGYPL
ncbi:hypothetical protein RSO01_92650 [Reyranella soli]|uniref:Uncharacterized protein n=1 Tax=Reyranella soli TaxID=1230389 RepID=A0A512NT47_9HYPH|nr:hypothetical protein RSO01_92650 [Reyranella soli]